MPSTYNGIASNVSRPGSVAISSSTNASPIAITTSSPHGLTTGDIVYIVGHTQAAANGRWSISVSSSTVFSLVGSSGTGAGSSGLVYTLFGPDTFQIPSDGDSRNAASVNTPLEAIADRLSFVAARALNGFQLVDYFEIVPSGANKVAGPGVTLTTLSSWTDTVYNSANNLLFTLGTTTSPMFNPGWQQNDLVEVEVIPQFNITAADTAYAKLQYQFNGSGYTDFTEGDPSMQWQSSAATFFKAPLKGLLTVGATPIYSFFLGISCAVGVNTTTLKLLGNTWGSVKVWRPT